MTTRHRPDDLALFAVTRMLCGLALAAAGLDASPVPLPDFGPDAGYRTVKEVVEVAEPAYCGPSRCDGRCHEAYLNFPTGR